MDTVTSSELRDIFVWKPEQLSRLSSRPEWPTEQARSGKGGEKSWLIAQLPATLTIKSRVIAVRDVVRARLSAAVEVVAPPAVVHLNPADLNETQRECNSARARLVNFVRDYSGAAQAAINFLNDEHAAGRLNHALRWAFEHAWNKPRGNVLSLTTLNKWTACKKKRGSYAPLKAQKDTRVKPWHMLAVELRRRPQGSTMKWLHEELAANWGTGWGDIPSYHAVNRFFKNKFSQIDQIKGRWTGSKLRSHKFYQHRSSEGLVPAQEVHADGWNTHFTAPHPVTGEFVTYEVWHFHDVATRYVTPPGLGLTENFEVIAKGLENFIRVFGVPLIVQTDSTKIVRGSARFTKDPIRSIEERVGCTIVHPKEVGNSQANGICENFNTSWLDKRSRELATYQSKGQMDDLTFKRVKKITADMVKAANAGDLVERDKKKSEAERMGKGLVFTSHTEAIEWLNQIHVEYNDRPHRSLSRVRGENGKLRHQAPAEALAEHVANGWQPVMMGDTPELHEMNLIDPFRPRTIVKVTRETVSPYGGMRFRNKDVLGHWNEKHVVVTYDIHEWKSVRVSDMNGEHICMAEFVEATGYRTQTAYENAEEKRAKSRIRNRENQIDQIRARTPGAAIEAPKPSFEHAQLIIEAKKLHEEAVVIEHPAQRAQQIEEHAAPAPLEGMNDEDKYTLWLQLDEVIYAGKQLEHAWQQRFHAGYPKTSAYRAQSAMHEEKAHQSGNSDRP